MARWQVQLRGNSFDLQELPPLFTSPDLQIVDESEEENRFFYLEATAFETLTDYKEVAEAAYELLPAILGSAQLKIGSLGDISVGAIHELKDDGQRHATIIYEVRTARLRLKGSVATLLFNGKEVPSPFPGSTDPDRWASHARRSQDVSEALGIWGTKPHNWHSLYGILEIIEHSGANLRQWASRNQLGRFAGQPTITSREARTPAIGDLT